MMMPKCYRKTKGSFALISFTLLLLLSACAFFTMENSDTYTSMPSSFSITTETVSGGKYEKDAGELIRIIEEVHPYFIVHPEPEENYLKARDNFLKSAALITNNDAFFLAGNRYLKALGDAHTRLNFSRYIETRILPGTWSWLEDKPTVTLLDTDVNNDRSWCGTGEVVAFNGIDIEEIGQLIDQTFAYENESGRLYNRSLYMKTRLMLKEVGIETGAVTVTLKDGNRTEEVDLFWQQGAVEPWPGSPSFSFQLLEDGSVALLTSRLCQLDKSWEDAVEAFQDAIALGIKKIIIDVRQNSGGNSSVWNPFYDAMDIVPGDGSGLIRFSPYAATLKHNAWFEGRTTGAHRYESNNQAVANPEIQLIVLCDERTFSAAHDLAIRIHDGHLGQVVGREPRNAPTRYIDSLSFTLPNTIFGGGVSYKYSIRPNPYLDEIGEGVVDILIPHGEDELTYALELFSER